MTISNEAVEAAGLKFRKKPVVIEAVQWAGDMSAVIAFVGHDLPTWGSPYEGALRIETLEGDHACQKGDWIIRGIKGELYPCKPDIFAATYEPAAHHMLPAPEGVSEAEERVEDWLDGKPYVEIRASDVRSILSALSSERERAERAERERDEARGVVRDTLWMARRYADGRQSYAVGMYNDAAKIAEAGGYAKGEPDGTLYALDGLRPEYQTLETRAQAAEAKVKELLGLLAPFLPINAVDTRDYAELSFGDHQTQAMTMQPDDWIALSDAALRWTETQGEKTNG